MRLRNKKTGKVVEALISAYGISGDVAVSEMDRNAESGYTDLGRYETLAGLNEEWEDYEPAEPIFDEKIRRGIRAWWDMQDNPFKAAAVLCHEEKDLDGFYHWRIFGYIQEGEQKESTDLCFRTKKLYDYKSYHDYTKEELCGEEE